MPPLEALACGVPVITANNSSLPEAIGKAGIMADCSTPEDLLKAMQDALSRIDSLIQQTITDGPEHARNFSWKKSAQVFLDAAREIN
jgi:glycosyltransferase involved in cell wall biosynthesis